MSVAAIKAVKESQVRVTRNQLLDDGFHLGIVKAPPYTVTQMSARCVRSLNYLQSGRDAPVEDNGMDECIRFHLEYLNPAVLDHIQFIDCQSMALGLFTDLGGDKQETTEEISVKVKTLEVFDPDFFKRIRTRQFTLWVINTGFHWMSIMLHAEDGKIEHYAINDPGRKPHVISKVDTRLRYVLGYGNVDVVPTEDDRKDIWFPQQQDRLSCGLRTYEILRTMIERLNDRFHEHGADSLYHNSLWDAMSGDFQLPKVRHLMMGIVAGRAMKHLHYKARISITPREFIRGFKGSRRAGRLDAYDGLAPVQSQQDDPSLGRGRTLRRKRLVGDAKVDADDTADFADIEMSDMPPPDDDDDDGDEDDSPSRKKAKAASHQKSKSKPRSSKSQSVSKPRTSKSQSVSKPRTSKSQSQSKPRTSKSQSKPRAGSRSTSRAATSGQDDVEMVDAPPLQVECRYVTRSKARATTCEPLFG